MSVKEDPSESMSSVMSGVELKASLRQGLKNLYKLPLVFLNCSFGIVTQSPAGIPLQTAVVKEAAKGGADVTIVFAVRRPG